MTDHERAIAVLERITGDLLKAADDLRAILHPAPKAPDDEPRAMAETFCAGDWIRPEPSPVWRQINNCAYCWCDLVKDAAGVATEHVVVALTGTGEALHLRRYDTLPYLTDAQFERACRAEQDEAADRLHHAEWKAGAA